MLGSCATDFEQLEPERLDPGEYAMERRLVGQCSCEKGLVIPRPGPQLRKGAEQPVAQLTSDVDLVARWNCVVVHAPEYQETADEDASTGSCDRSAYRSASRSSPSDQIGRIGRWLLIRS
jgi:hypothetical protein